MATMQLLIPITLDVFCLKSPAKDFFISLGISLIRLCRRIRKSLKMVFCWSISVTANLLCISLWQIESIQFNKCTRWLIDSSPLSDSSEWTPSRLHSSFCIIGLEMIERVLRLYNFLQELLMQFSPLISVKDRVVLKLGRSCSEYSPKSNPLSNFTENWLYEHRIQNLNTDFKQF